jgi:hypothetical protein
MQQRNLESFGDFGKQLLKTPCWTQWMCWSQTRGLLGISSSKLAMCLVRMFVGFWPKKKDEIPSDNLWKLVTAFNTIEDHVRAMKRMSMK